ncbi:hypothetical protein FBU59_004969 [Linderina macrospora]|uniref:Uncharacterized protein n=1 Tax=Linderina macrospora TaxID=4868 RepID=A0ACC1J452_9FUNG|nr:hypothetical protein FBU59_004969 [Linderina macrospora]
MLVKHNVDCGFLVDADKALRTYVFRTQAQEILELLHGFTAHNSVYPDEDEMGMVAATLSV